MHCEICRNTLILSVQRIDRIKSSLTSDLESHFAATLSTLASNDKTKMEKVKQPEAERAKLMSDLTDCLRAYDMLGLWRDAEDVIRRELVREFAKKVRIHYSLIFTSNLIIDASDRQFIQVVFLAHSLQ